MVVKCLCYKVVDMKQIFISVFNILVRNVNPGLKVILSFCFFGLSAYFLVLSIRKKNDKNPIAWGWLILCLVCMSLGVVYSVF